MNKHFRKILILLFLPALLFISCGQQKDAPVVADSSTQTVEPSFSAREFVTSYIADLANGNKVYPMDTFVERMRAGEDLFVVDIRRAEDYAAGHVKGAVNIPWNTPALWEDMAYLPQDKPVYLYCYSGQTAGQTLITMRMAGIESYSVNSGWNLGISRTEGYEEIVETTVNTLDRSKKNNASPAALKAVQDYYESTFAFNGSPFANRHITEDDAKATLDAKDDSVMFISICRPDDYSKGRIPTSINIPSGPGWNDAMAGLPTDKKLILNCYSGQGTNQFVVLLTLMGYDPLSLTFGMGTPRTAPRGWVNKGYEVETD